MPANVSGDQIRRCTQVAPDRHQLRAVPAKRLPPHVTRVPSFLIGIPTTDTVLAEGFSLLLALDVLSDCLAHRPVLLRGYERQQRV